MLNRSGKLMTFKLNTLIQPRDEHNIESNTLKEMGNSRKKPDWVLLEDQSEATVQQTHFAQKIIPLVFFKKNQIQIHLNHVKQCLNFKLDILMMGLNQSIIKKHKDININLVSTVVVSSSSVMGWVEPFRAHFKPLNTDCAWFYSV